MCRVNNMLPNNKWVKDEIKRDGKKNYEINENGNTITQNLWDVTKAVLRGNFITINVYIKKNESSQTTKLNI